MGMMLDANGTPFHCKTGCIFQYMNSSVFCGHFSTHVFVCFDAPPIVYTHISPPK